MGRTMRIRKDDQVVVIGGKDAGKTGRVVRTEPKRDRVYVEHLNMIKRHEKPRSVKDAQRGGEVGGIVEKEGPIHVSNVMLLDPKDNKPTRVGVRRDEGGKRERFAKRSGASFSMEATATQTQPAPPPRLRDRYNEEVLPALVKRFRYTTPMQAPTLTKITLNMGLGEAKQNNKMLEAAQEQLATIAGQQPSVRRARKSIASFKVREGMPVGISVTLRRARMWEFLDRLCSIAVPRIRDFRGLNPRSFDGRGNYSMGVKEQLIFPEIDYDSIDEVRGLDITITTTAQSDLEAFELLLALGMPFAQDGRPGGADEEKVEEEEEEKRKEEARAKAEAEAAALEQLKEENPDAYAKPEPEPEDGEDAEGEGGDDGGDGDAESKPDEESSDDG